jgi:hypothetical protein
VAGLAVKKRAARGTLQAKSVPSVAHFGIKSVPPARRVANITRFAFPQQNQCAVPKCAADVPIRGEPFLCPMDFGLVRSSSVRKGHSRKSLSGGQRIIGDRHREADRRAGPIFGNPAADARSILRPECLLPTPTAGHHASATSPLKGQTP